MFSLCNSALGLQDRCLINISLYGRKRSVRRSTGVVLRESLKRTWYSPCFCALRRMYTLWNFPVNTGLPSLAQMYCFVTPSNMHVRWPRFSQAIRALTAPTSMGNIMYCWTHHKRFHIRDKATILAKIFGTLGYFWKHFQYIYFRPLFPQLNVDFGLGK